MNVIRWVVVTSPTDRGDDPRDRLAGALSVLVFPLIAQTLLPKPAQEDERSDATA